ncbi:uncharacterized protein LOC110229777 isoform X2 [Arabidopsis lyrata subsp. lyrata]|uniref:uncharacterized protein LOC110229777 isoform X2 n=1 Tax=Arabidopsis lyrata subsp. lyrata TaxID=81972 RepID=UPI000A29BDB5|nr:uncharacterized protein LOC110229777 isoform X2 [Arabidopsis lyrata subsp. lyrata]|eukprot:XP_020886272.1 uncharacterized protein LOC110229777 isoform X2 [Arabidopsis lyrata subsp. lyrata]
MTETILGDSCQRQRKLPATERSACDGESFTYFRTSNCLDDEDEVCICEELDDLVFGELEAGEGTRMDISVSVPPSDTCSTPEKGQGNYSLFLPPARDSAVISIGSTHSTAAHENQKNLIL